MCPFFHPFMLSSKQSRCCVGVERELLTPSSHADKLYPSHQKQKPNATENAHQQAHGLNPSVPWRGKVKWGSGAPEEMDADGCVYRGHGDARIHSRGDAGDGVNPPKSHNEHLHRVVRLCPSVVVYLWSERATESYCGFLPMPCLACVAC